MTAENVLYVRISISLGRKISSHAQKIGSLYLLGVLFKISDEHPRFFYIEVTPPPLPRVKCKYLAFETGIWVMSHNL